LDFARRERKHGIVLLLDDAQFLNTVVFETVRSLLDCGEGPEPLFRAALAGTIELEEKLIDPQLDGFQQRVVARLYLDNFLPDETAGYVAGQAGHDVFSSQSLPLIHRLTDGLPRSVNQLCDAALELAAERAVRSIDETLIQTAWAQLQQIDEPAVVSALLPAAVKQSEEELNDIVARKKGSLQLKTFDCAVEFGTLNETDSLAAETCTAETSAKEYKPAYPLDDEEEREEEKSRIAECELCTSVVLTATVKKLFTPLFERHSPFSARFRRSPFRSVFTFSPAIPPMDKETLERYGAEVLDEHPPFVRNELHYVYQTADTVPAAETPETEHTGGGIALNWQQTEQHIDSGYGTAYSLRENHAGRQEETVLPAVPAQQIRSSLDEPFEETAAVPKDLVSLGQLYQTVADSVLLLQKSKQYPAVYAMPDDSLFQQQLDTVLRRLVRAAEKIERAADISEDAGEVLQQTAEFIENEVQVSLPHYTELFKELSDFHRTIFSELEQLRTETERRKPERRILQIDRSSRTTIDARMLFQ
ncbi:MAG: hypothetical protein LBN39_12860, partial [Planctomycetaceae bacterium]|nr:hypothetical protein [Planctomycetaceae bacterium]